MESGLETIPRTAFGDGVNLCMANGERLLSSAAQALRERNFTCAFIKGFAALEEFGKALLILEGWSKDSIGKNVWDRGFKSHPTKMRMARYLVDVAFLKEHGLIQDESEGRWADEDYVKSACAMRTDCLYVDFDFKEKRWKSPLEISDKLEGWAGEIVRVGELSMKAVLAEKNRMGT